MASGLTIIATGLGKLAQALHQRDRQVEQVVRRARGTLGRRLRAEASRDIRREYNLSAKRVNADLYTRPDGDGVLIIGKGRPIGAIEYGARWAWPKGRKTPTPARGATWQYRKDGPRETRPGTFIATLPNGARHVMWRNGPKRRMTRGNYVGRLKQPISVLYEGSVAHFLRDDQRRERLVEYGRGILRAELARLAGYKE
jgi:hypothetical protein